MQKFMKDNFKLLFSDSIIRMSLIISVILISLQTALIAFFYSKLPPLVPVLNSQTWGNERLYSSSVTLLFPIILLLILITNIFTSSFYYKKHSLIARILSFNSLICIILSLLAYLQIILLVY